jgi:kynureninase
MEPKFQAAPGAAAWQLSNPSILAAAPLLASLSIFSAAGIAPLREKSVALTGFLEAQLAPLAADVRIITPRDAGQRGCQLSLRIKGAPGRGRQVFEALGARGIIVDWRAPDILRVAPVPLYNGFEDAFTFATTLAQVLRA